VRVIECNFCGETIAGANDDDLIRNLERHVEASHSDVGFSEEQIRERVAAGAYDASDS
jgi:predicted small metal-binding protein